MLGNLYEKLKNIILEEEAFYSSIQKIDGYSIESFSYRLANSQMFEREHTREMRGISFIYGKEITKPQLFTFGFHKFFNYGEKQEIIDTKEIESIQDKVDGSLILFGMLPNGKIIAKSKTSIESEMAKFANIQIQKDKKLYNFIEKNIKDGNFPIFEFVGPDNRIVVSYEKNELVLLGMRKQSGEYFPAKIVEEIHKQEIPHIQFSKIHQNISFEELLKKQESDSGYEGFIVNFFNGEKLKIKLASYVLKHSIKGSISNLKTLCQICLNEETDDLRTLFIGDELALEIINSTEEKVFSYYNHTVSETEKLLEENNALFKKYNSSLSEEEKRGIRKEIAIKNHSSKYFSLLIKNLLGTKVDYKEFVMKNIDEIIL